MLREVRQLPRLPPPGFLATFNLILRFLDLGAIIAQYNDF